MSLPKLLAIVGPTGTGKSDLAVEVARRTGAEIISADSMQVYRGMDIGTAKPSRALREEIPHHAIDVVDPDDPMSAGRFAALARAAAHAALARGSPVVLCGGTGLYARAFAGGLLEGVGADPELRAELEALSSEALAARLREVDPALAARVHPNNRVRMVRYLEIHGLGGDPASDRQTAHAFADRPFDVRWLGLDLPREPLWKRLEARLDAMLAAGWVEEVQALHASGYGPELKPLRAIGYREIGELLAGHADLATTRERIFVATRRFARRQRTWFKVEPGMQWIDARQRGAALERALAQLGA
jgi:tRNA dimethylallyltransferase